MLAFVGWLACWCTIARAIVLRATLSRRQLGAWLAIGVAAGIGALLVGPGGLVLQKVVARLVMPAAWAWDAAWLAVVYGVARARRRIIAFGAAAGILLTFAGSEAVGHALFHWLERDYQADPYAQGSFDAVFVLGGGIETAPHAHFELGAAGDRVVLGARLYHRGLATRLVITGTPIEGLHGADSVTATRTVLRDLGVPGDAIVEPSRATRNTREEARAAADLVRSTGWQRVALVTSAWHMRRARALFRDAGVDAVPLPADHRGELRWDGLYSIVPLDAGYYMVSKASWELLGALVGF
jgi:uncharacterized SAM-binding protein YcdF (DUF218 family)